MISVPCYVLLGVVNERDVNAKMTEMVGAYKKEDRKRFRRKGGTCNCERLYKDGDVPLLSDTPTENGITLQRHKAQAPPGPANIQAGYGGTRATILALSRRRKR